MTEKKNASTITPIRKMTATICALTFGPKFRSFDFLGCDRSYELSARSFRGLIAEAVKLSFMTLHINTSIALYIIFIEAWLVSSCIISFIAVAYHDFVFRFMIYFLASISTSVSWCIWKPHLASVDNFTIVLFSDYSHEKTKCFN